MVGAEMNAVGLRKDCLNLFFLLRRCNHHGHCTFCTDCFLLRAGDLNLGVFNGLIFPLFVMHLSFRVYNYILLLILIGCLNRIVL